MRTLAAILICCAMALPAQGNCKREKNYAITSYGAVPDSTLVQTRAIQKAIDAAAVRGGTVVVPAGVWMSGALFFKPGTRLRLEEGAVLKGSTAQEDYPDVQVHIEGVLQPWSAALVNADGCDGFSITGKGTLDGNGLPAWEAFWARRKENPQCTNLEVRRARLVSVSRSSDVRIEGVKLRNSAFWNIHLYKCDNVSIKGVDIYAPIKPVKAPSSDGIDLDACCNVHISGCKLATGDDLIAIKGGKGPWADENPDNGTNSNILVEDCEFGHGPGALVFGSECIGAENVILRRCKADGTDRLLWLKMRPDTPQRYAGILVEDVSGKVKNVVYIKPWTQFFDLGGRTDLPVSVAEDITVQRCTLKCTRSRNIVEAPDQYTVRNLHFQDNKWSWNYNKKEEKVKPYVLPDPLVFADGRKVESPGQWPARRREILDIFQKEMYGDMPPASPVYLTPLSSRASGEIPSQEGTRNIKRVRMTFREDGAGPHIDWMIVYPGDTQGSVPAVMLLNYYGNDDVLSGTRHPKSATVFPIDEILSRGYAFVTACYEDISPDPDSLQNAGEQLAIARTGMYGLWDKDCTTGSIMAWAWGLCRGMDMLEKDAGIDASRVLLTGSSRLGKAALVAAAFDERFKNVCVNQTGGGGVPLAKRNFGEYVGSEIDHFGYWWCKEFAKYAGNEKKMPFDQHMLLACVAPRRLLVEGFNNPWFDTYGEYLSLQSASPVWNLLGEEGLPLYEWPSNKDTGAIGHNLGYVRRDGLHGIDADDWRWMLDFANKQLP
ncbi:MAG: right-handed parallel beta-helix repeat-containing protein [Bacteroidales bacterium]|nr:right-handed parallel beta-helix repeat-containing protein [Bacteroidales bacterium]